MEHQLHSNWCWVAVATSVALFYRPQIKWTQCRVANSNLGRKNCCQNAANGKCNKIGHLQDSLSTVRHARRPRYITRPVPFADVRAEIDAGRPVCVRTQWAGGQVGHVMAVTGYDTEYELLTVDDPLYGKSHVDYDTFCTDYRGSGSWTRSYYTKL